MADHDGEERHRRSGEATEVGHQVASGGEPPEAGPSQGDHREGGAHDEAVEGGRRHRRDALQVVHGTGEGDVHHDGGGGTEGDGVGDAVQDPTEVMLGAEPAGRPAVDSVEDEAQEDEGGAYGDVGALRGEEVDGQQATQPVGHCEHVGDAHQPQVPDRAHGLNPLVHLPGPRPGRPGEPVPPPRPAPPRRQRRPWRGRA